MPPLLKVNKFHYGITDAFSRGDSPEGSFEDLRNLLPVKVGGLRTAFGYKQDVAAFPTGFRLHGNAGGALTLESFEWHPFPFSVEAPTSYDGKVDFFKDTSGASKENYHFALDTWFNYLWKGNDTAVSDDGGYVLIDERKEITDDVAYADVTITGASTYDIVVDNTSNRHDLNTNDDYYNGWRIEWFDNTDSSIDYAYVVNYAYAADTGTFTVKKDIGSSYANWVAWHVDDKLTLRRWFHRPAAMVPTFDPTNPGDCFASEGRVRGCGAASSDEDYFPWVAQFINRTFFTGHAGAETYRGTYVDQMECSEVCNDDGEDVINSINLGIAGSVLLPAAIYHVGYTLEYDGYQESRLGPFATTTAADGSTHNEITFQMRLRFARMSKRVTAINIYVKQEISGVQSQPYFIKRHDLVNPTTDEITAGWYWANSTNNGQWYNSTTNDAFWVKAEDWNNRGGSYYARTGRVEELDGDRHIVAWRHTTSAAGRQFFAYFYDPTDAATYVDQVRFTGIRSSGASSYDVIPADRDDFEFDIEGYQGDSVTGLAEDSGWLIMFKESSVHGRYVTAYKESWSPLLISDRAGCASRHSIVYLPQGIGFADTNGFKMLVNQRVIPLTNSIENTYKAFDGGFGEIRAWYEPIDESLRITDGVDTSNRYVWVCYVTKPFNLPDGRPAFPWYKLQHPANHYVEWVFTNNEGDTSFTNSYGTFQGVFGWGFYGSDYYKFGGASNYIVPYLKTHEIVADEAAVVSFDKVAIVKSGDGDGGTLDCKLSIEGLTKTFSDLTKTLTHLFLKVSVTDSQRKGRVLQIEYNTDGSPEYNADGTMNIHEIQVFGQPEEPWNESV